MFFILDEENKPEFFRDVNTKIDYPLLNVFSPKQPRESNNSLSQEDESASESSDDSEEEEEKDISVRMLSQFVTERD